MVEPGKANSNVDFLSRQRGQEEVQNIPVDFPDKFLEIGTQDLEEGAIFHVNGQGESEF